MNRRLYDWIVPPSALRWGRLTKSWPHVIDDAIAYIGRLLRNAGTEMAEIRAKLEAQRVPPPTLSILPPNVIDIRTLKDPP